MKTGSLKQSGRLWKTVACLMAAVMSVAGAGTVYGLAAMSGGVAVRGLVTDTEKKPEDESSQDGDPAALPLVDRLTGRYACRSADGNEYYTLELMEFGGNLYASAGVGVLAEDGRISPYSFRALELIPEKAGDLLNTESNSCTVGVISFSVMADAGRYAGVPSLCRISLTGGERGSIVLSAAAGAPVPREFPWNMAGTVAQSGSSAQSDQSGLPDGTGQSGQPDAAGQSVPSYTFIRDDRVVSFFTSIQNVPLEDKGVQPPEDLYGLWRLRDSAPDAPVFLSFTGENGLQIYQKAPGEEVVLGQGVFACGRIPFAVGKEESGESGGGKGRRVSAGNRDSYSPAAALLTMTLPVYAETKAQEPMSDHEFHAFYSLLGNGAPMEIRRQVVLGDRDTLVFMADPEEASGTEGAGVTAAEARSAGTVTAAADPAVYGEPYPRQNSALPADALFSNAGRALVFDRVREQDVPVVVLAQPDDVIAIRGEMAPETAGGNLRAVIPQFLASEDVENNGGYFVRVGDLIYFRRFLENSFNTCAMWGDFLGENGTGIYAGRSQVCFYNRMTGETGIAFGGSGEGPIYYADGWIYSLTLAGNGYGVVRCWPDGHGLQSAAGIPQVSAGSEAAGSSGSAASEEAGSFGSAVSEEAGSSGSAASEETGTSGDAASDAAGTSGRDPAGYVALSEGTWGDLMLYESLPYKTEMTQLVPGFIPLYPFLTNDGDVTRIFQRAEIVDGAAYLILADARYDLSRNAGWEMAYEPTGFTWQRIQIRGVPRRGFDDDFTVETLAASTLSERESAGDENAGSGTGSGTDDINAEGGTRFSEEEKGRDFALTPRDHAFYDSHTGTWELKEVFTEEGRRPAAEADKMALLVVNTDGTLTLSQTGNEYVERYRFLRYEAADGNEEAQTTELWFDSPVNPGRIIRIWRNADGALESVCPGPRAVYAPGAATDWIGLWEKKNE